MKKLLLLFLVWVYPVVGFSAIDEGKTDINYSNKYTVKTLDTPSTTVYKEINGHRLPPEPDPAVNNSRLLGIDSNGNGVRDDVERWIYITYKDKHPIHIDIAMQVGRAKQKMLEDPSKAKEIHDEMSAPLYCEAYYKIYAKYFNEPLLISKDVVTRHFRSIIFNTLERKKAYLEYDKLLSGDTYITPKIGEGKNLCDFNTDKYEE